MASGASSHATTTHYKTFCSTNAWAGFWPELSVPRRLHHQKCSSQAGSRFLPSFHPEAALCDGRKVAEIFTLLSLCLQIPVSSHCPKSCKSLSQILAFKFSLHSLEERGKIDFMAKLCSMKFLFVPFFLSFSSSLHDFCVWKATTDFPCGFLQHYCNNCLHC